MDGAQGKPMSEEQRKAAGPQKGKTFQPCLTIFAATLVQMHIINQSHRNARMQAMQSWEAKLLMSTAPHDAFLPRLVACSNKRSSKHLFIRLWAWQMNCTRTGYTRRAVAAPRCCFTHLRRPAWHHQLGSKR